MKQYIITDSEHNRLWILLPKFGLEERRGKYATVSIDSIIEINNILQNVGSQPYATTERDKVLDELLVWVKKNNVNHEDSDGDRLPVIVTGKIMNKISELRTATPEHNQ